jgi:pimeloyl-ACP methyl ester carboxylesterase
MIHYRETGPHRGRPILFLHAGSYSGTMSSGFCRRLGERRCVLPDLSGHGHSRHVPLRDLTQADAVSELLEQRDGGGPIERSPFPSAPMSA